MSEQNQDGFFRQKIWPSMREFIAGSFAGVGLILAGHPFDTIKVSSTSLSPFLPPSVSQPLSFGSCMLKVRLQTEGGFGRFKGPVDCLLTTLKEERVFGLYKGAMGPMIGQGAVSASQFSIFTTILPHVSSVCIFSPVSTSFRIHNNAAPDTRCLVALSSGSSTQRSPSSGRCLRSRLPTIVGHCLTHGSRGFSQELSCLPS